MAAHDPRDLNGFGKAASGANVSRLLEMKRARSAPAECPECGGAAPGHRRGCSRDPAQERPKPPSPPAPPARSLGRLCLSCGQRVGKPGLRHKYGCTEYAGMIKAETIEPAPVMGGPTADRRATLRLDTIPAPESVPGPAPVPEPEPEPGPAAPAAVPTPEPAPAPAPAAARVAPPEVQTPGVRPSYPVAPTPRLVAEPDAVPGDDAGFYQPSVSALNAVRAPCLNAGVRLLSRLGDDDAKWVLDALYRISRGLRAPRP